MINLSINVEFYNLSKRDNSTKQPSGSPVLTAACDLKEECGIIRPVLLVHGIANPSNLNYVHIPSFNRFYYVSEWTWRLGLWEASLYVDVLATYKTQIGNATEYVVRSSHSYDGKITDNYYPSVAIDDSDSVTITSPLGGTLSNGHYVLGVINDNGGMGAVEYYRLDPTQFSTLCGAMFANNPAWYDLSGVAKSTPADITEIALPTEVMKSLVNPMQYVTSCQYFGPGVTVPVTGSVTDIHFGWWDSNVPAYKVGQAAYDVIYGSFSIPAHPQAASRGIYLNIAPYTKITFNAGPFGFFPVDSTYFADSLSGAYRIGVDCVTGEGTLTVLDDNGNIISVHRAQIGVPIKMAAITRDYLQTAANVVNVSSDIGAGIGGTVGKALTGDIAGAFETGFGAAGKVANGIVSSIKGAMPVLTAAGSGGSLYEINRNWSITVQHFLLAEEDNANRGRPLAKKKKISDIPGYIMVLDADLATDGFSAETEQVRSYMEGGFFYE